MKVPNKNDAYYRQRWYSSWGTWWDITKTVFKDRYRDIVFICPKHGEITRHFRSLTWANNVPCPHCSVELRCLDTNRERIKHTPDEKPIKSVPSLGSLIKPKRKNKNNISGKQWHERPTDMPSPDMMYIDGTSPMASINQKLESARPFQREEKVLTGNSILIEDAVTVNKMIGKEVYILDDLRMVGKVIGYNESINGLYNGRRYPVIVEIVNHHLSCHIGHIDYYSLADISLLETSPLEQVS